jgi:glycerol kinase
MKKYILAIDQGTTGTRANLYNHQGQVVGTAYQEFTQYFPKPGWVEHDADEIWQSVLSTIKKATAKINKKEIAAIGITNQRETTVIWDKKTGKPLHRAIVWQCRRTADVCDKLKRNQKLVDLVRNKTGLVIDAYFPATKIAWLLKKIKRTDICFGTIDSWLVYQLTGRERHVTDYTNASRSMLFNIRTKKWDEELLKIFKVPKNILPQVVHSSGVAGLTKKLSVLPDGIAISGMAGDQQAALFGQTCFTKGSGKNTYGTGCFLLVNTGQDFVISKNGLLTTLACDAKGNPCYALEGAVFIGGAVMQWIRDGLQILPKASLSEKISKSIKDTGGVYLVPAFVGLGAPYWNPTARGAIVGITRGTSQKEIIRAGLESIAYQSAEVIDLMRKETGLSIKDLQVDGGAVSNNFLMQFQADLLGGKILRPENTETTSLGAAYLAGLGVGFWKNSDELKKYHRIQKVFKAKITFQKQRLLMDAWKQAVARVL